MSTTRETQSARGGTKLRDKFDHAKPFVEFSGVGRMQQRGVVNVLFDLDDDEKTVPFQTTVGRGKGRYLVNGQWFDGGGTPVGGTAPVAAPTPEPAPEPEPEPIAAELAEEEEIPSEDVMGI